MDSLLVFNKDAISEFNLVIYGTDEWAKKLFMLCFNENIYISGFIGNGNYSILGKHILNIDVIKNDPDHYRIIIPHMVDNEARNDLIKYNLENLVVDLFRLNDSFKKNKRTVIYGTGERGEDTYNLLNFYRIENIVFCDSNPSKWGTTYCGETIISVSELRELDDEVQVVIASEAVEAIVKTVNQAGKHHVYLNRYNERTFQVSDNNKNVCITYANIYFSIVQDFIRYHHKVLLLGNSAFVVNYADKLRLLDINIAYILCDSIECLDNEKGFLVKSIESITNEKDAYQIVICFSNYSDIYNKLLDLDVNEYRVSYYLENTKSRLSSIYYKDPLTSFCSVRDKRNPGYVILENNNKGHKCTIIALGGDTNAEIYCHRERNVYEYLYDICNNNGFNIYLLAGGVGSQNVHMTLLKLIRDMCLLKNDETIVINLCGRRDYAHYWNINQRYLTEKQYSTMGITDDAGYFFGLDKSMVDCYDFFETQLRMLYAICNEFGMKLFNFFDHDVCENLIYKHFTMLVDDETVEKTICLNLSDFEREIFENTYIQSPFIINKERAYEYKRYSEICNMLSNKYEWCYDAKSFSLHDISCDGGHLNSKGAQHLAEEMYSIIKNQLHHLSANSEP
jgi:hypothetical protein